MRPPWLMMCVGSLAWWGEAGATMPDRVAAELAAGSGNLSGLQTTESGRIVVGRASGGLYLLDTRTWQVASPSEQPCTVIAVAARDEGARGAEVAAGCDNGVVFLYRWTGSQLRGWQDGGLSTAVELGNEDIGWLVWPPEDSGGRLYGVIQLPGGGWQGFRLRRMADGYLEDTPSPFFTLPQGLRVSTVGYPVDQGGTTQVTTQHTGTQWSLVTPTTGSALSTVPMGIPTTAPVHLTPRFDGGAWGVTDAGEVIEYNGASTGGVIIAESGLGTLRAITEVSVGNSVQYALIEEDSVVVRDGFGSGAVDRDVFPVDPAGRIVSLINPKRGLVVGGTTDGGFAVLTQAPWIDDFQISPNEGDAGVEVSFSFSSDSAGSWSVQIGGGPDEAGGDEVGRGTLDEPGEITGSFVVPETVEEGVNEVWAFVTDETTGIRGSALATFTTDRIPEQVQLRPSDVASGPERLLVSLRPLDIADIAFYRVYVSAEPFEASDYPTGGPETRIRSRSYPRVVDQPADTSSVEIVSISPLNNDTPYYIAIRAVDEGGAEGPMSDVVSGTPADTCGAAQCAGDAGGCGGDGCASVGGASSSRVGPGLLLLAGASLFRRRRRRGWAGAGAMGAIALGWVVGALLIGPVAVAQDTQSARSPFSRIGDGDITPAWINVEFSYGSFAFDDDTIPSVYGDRAGIFRMEFGAQLFRYVELDAGLGLLSPTGNTLSAGGVASAEEVRMQWLPLTLAITGRLHFIDEQPLVPYARIGIDNIFWRETPLDADGAAVAARRVTGVKQGWHWGVGGNLLLDFFAPRRASMLEATTGINDTWLFVEYRRQFIGAGGPGLDFSGWSLSGGLKIDY